MSASTSPEDRRIAAMAWKDFCERRCVLTPFSPRPLAVHRAAPRTPGALPQHTATRKASRGRRIAHFVRGGLSGRHFVLGHLRSIGRRLERLGRFRHILRHARQAEVVELPTSYSPLLDDKCWIRCDVHFSRDDPSWTRHSSRAALPRPPSSSSVARRSARQERRQALLSAWGGGRARF